MHPETLIRELRKRIAQRDDAEVVAYTFYDVAIDKKILAELNELRKLRREYSTSKGHKS